MNDPYHEHEDRELLKEHAAHPERFRAVMPVNPFKGQRWTDRDGLSYEWDGESQWVLLDLRPPVKTENPKEEAGRKKCPMHLLPPVALRQAAYVHQHGSDKYGQFNWRHAGINATTYIGAILRHLTSWADGEDNDPETGISHIAHIIAGCNIVLDAQSLGMMNDDRSKVPTPEEAAERMSRSVLCEVTPGKPVPCAPNPELDVAHTNEIRYQLIDGHLHRFADIQRAPNPAYTDAPIEEIRGTFVDGSFRSWLHTEQ